jgi:REP element-mobilizing transposase RayT
MPSRYDPDKHHRRSIRLRGFDYSTSGAYFITIGTRHHARLFGQIANGAMHLNAAGAMVEQQWQGLSLRFPSITLDILVVMPDHTHAIVWLHGDPSITLGTVIGAFKSLTTNAYIAGVREQGWPTFDRRLWERDYYEHIVRNEESLARIRTYIEQNPARWNDRSQ